MESIKIRSHIGQDGILHLSYFFFAQHINYK
jgi:hypothetical protein